MKNNFKKTIRVEFIKKKRSAIFTLSILIGLLVPLIIFISRFINLVKGEQRALGIPSNFYFENLKNALTPFASFFFPILIIFCASKIAQIDHKNKGWHLMETQPTTKLSIYFSKYIMLLISNCIAIGTLLLSTFVFTFVLTVIFDIPADKLLDIPFIDFFKIGLRLFVISLCVSAFQYALSVLISSFIWPIIIGFIALVIPLILVNLSINMDGYIYQQLTQIANFPAGSDFGYWFTFSDVLSVLYSVLFLTLGYHWYRNKSFTKAFLKSKKQAFKFIGFLVIMIGSIYFTLQPRVQQPHDKTVITGSVLSDLTIKNVYFFDALVGDTIAKAKIENQKFSLVIPKKLQADFYVVQFDYYTKKSIFFGANDSIDLNYQMFGKYDKLSVKGTRIAENSQNKKLVIYGSILDFYLENNRIIDDADYYMKTISKLWEENLDKIESIRTVDNLVPRNDYIVRNKKLISLVYLGYWNEFKKKRNALFPDKQYTVSADILKLENSITLSDKTLMSNLSYVKYVLDELTKDDKREVADNQKYFSVIEKMNPSPFRDRLLYMQLSKSLSESQQTKERDSLMDTYFHLISKKSYKDILKKSYITLNRLTMGEEAPSIVAYNANEKKYDLSSFKGKLVLIDCWASWCGPCKQEEPFYLQKALSYKNKPIQFISMNIDNKKENWLIDIKGKGEQILQLRPEDINDFTKKYGITSIPRFILIDEEGRLINADFVRPSSKVFDELIKPHLKNIKI